MKMSGGKPCKNEKGVENLVEKVQNSSKIVLTFHFSTHRGSGKVENSRLFYSSVENRRCRKK
jgi:hypothetical protein